MSGPTRNRSTRSSNARYTGPDLTPTESTIYTNEASSRFDITLQGLDDGLLTMTARLRPGARTRSVERAIRRYLGPDIQESDTLQIYRDGETLRADERLGHNSQLLHYRVFPTTSVERPLSAQVATASTNASVGDIPSVTLPVPRSGLKPYATVAQVRDFCGRARGAADPNAIVIRLVGGMRAGPLEGNDWQLQKAAKWQPENVVVTLFYQPSYLVLRGCGKEYLYQTPREDGDGVSVGNLKRWLKHRLIRGVHPTLDTQITVSPADISLYVGNKLVSRDTSVLAWMTEVEFGLSPDVEAAFSAEEKWLCPSFECTLCQETISDTAPRVSAGCTHDPTACTPCIRRWVSTRLTEDGWNKARCPVCSHPLANNEIKAYTSKEDFERYEMLATKAALESIADFHWCLEKGCGSGQIHEPSRGNSACPDTLFVCHACNGRQCTRHAVRWHESLTCEEYERRNSPRLRQERASELTIRGVSKQCPGCSRSVNKDVGCNHITCVCGHEWCYLCLAAWTQCKRTNIPFCKHRAQCPERNNNPFLNAQPRPDRTPGYPDLDDLDDDNAGGWIESYPQVVRPHVQPLPVRPLRSRYHHTGPHPPSPVTQYPALESFRHRPSWMPNPAFASPHFAENPGFPNGPPQSFLGPPPADPRHNMRPSSPYLTWPGYGELAPLPAQGPPLNHNARGAADRRRRPSVSWQLPNDFEQRESPGMSAQYPMAGAGQPDQALVNSHHPFSRAGYSTWAPVGVRRPQVKVPTGPGLLARMRTA